MVVVGAGAAGFAAARLLADRGADVVLLEARKRVGGRAFTARLETWPADMGCAWLHSADRNPLVSVAARLGLAVDRTLPDCGTGFARAHQLDAPAAAAREAAFARFWQAVDDHEGPDRALGDVVPDGDPWRANFAAVTSFISGALPEELSLVDLARYSDSLVNWRVIDGYGTLFERLAHGLPVSLGAEVTAIDWGGPAVAVTTRLGSLRCRAALVTVPVPLIAQEAIRFTPRLPDAKLAAAEGLPMGHVAKLLLAFDGDPFGLGPDRQVTGSLRRAATAIHHLHPLGRPLVETYWGGPTALALERAGMAAMADVALAELQDLFGTGVRDRMRPLLASSWAADPFARGAYSFARPGGADGRAVLAEPVVGRLYFAGEACSRDAYSTAHGAYATGIAAGAAILKALG